MLKYVPAMTSVVMEEIPGKVTLAIDISNCRGNCIGCHSPFLKLDIGEELTEEAIDRLIDDNFGVNCFLFMGEGWDHERLMELARYVKEKHHLEIGLYSGRQEVEDGIWELFDYVKVGPYLPDKGPLTKKTTNQRLYHITEKGREDITARFWYRGLENQGRVI